MPGLLITPKQFFFGIRDEVKSDFINWQLCCIDHEAKKTICGEISGHVSYSEADIFSAQLTWGAEAGPDRKWNKMTTKVEIPLDDHTGCSHKDGGCHFTPALTRTTEFFLVPPGEMERTETAKEWRLAKEAGSV